MVLRPALPKANIVAAIFKREIRVVSRVGDNLGGLILDKAQIDALVLETRMQSQARSYSQPQTAALTGLCCSAVPDAIQRGFLCEIRVGNNFRVPESAIERFKSRYAVLSQVAKDLGTSSIRLLRICDKNGILVEKLARRKGEPQQPLIQRSGYAQLIEIWQARSRNRKEIAAIHLESLGEYLDKLRSTGSWLPRTVGQPNKVVIARACRFPRHLLYLDRNLVALLAKFDEEECRRFGVGDFTPAQKLNKYLLHLRDSAKPIPTLRSGKVNKLAVAKAAQIDRNHFYDSPEITNMLQTHIASD